MNEKSSSNFKLWLLNHGYFTSVSRVIIYQNFIGKHFQWPSLLNVCVIYFQCCQVQMFRNRQFALWKSPKSPLVEPKIAGKSPHFYHFLANFCPGRPFLMHFYMTMFSKIEICKILLPLSQENFSKNFHL